uniref:Uncharacterized protein n=1 Tax=Percolomonas cosmopolitus TaxID=63605 RepID=A0A7S1PFQ4_9EUKA|mmetsp:Transcript_10899/g.40648  ORF Transcript_10899/g.40648 Transcript_10899/m.40648 type:complete len:460 (+) Transcript_10899:218-1597(+)
MSTQHTKSTHAIKNFSLLFLSIIAFFLAILSQNAFASDSSTSGTVDDSANSLTTLQLLHQYQSQQDLSYTPTTFNDHAPIFNPQCFRASHYQSQYNAQLIHYLKKNVNVEDPQQLDDFLEWKGYDFRADGCNLTMILREVDAINDNYSRMLATIGSVLEKSISSKNLHTSLWLAARIAAYWITVNFMSLILPMRFHVRASARIIVGFVFACVGAFFLDDFSLSLIGLISLSAGIAQRKPKPWYIKVMGLATSFLWMCIAIHLDSKVLGFGFAISVHSIMAYIGYLFWKCENRIWFAVGNVVTFLMYTLNLLQYIMMAHQIQEGTHQLVEDDLMLTNLFLEAWKWCAVVTFTIFWNFSLFPARILIKKEWTYHSLVVFVQSITTMTVVAMLLLYGRYISFTFNIFHLAALVLSCSLVIFVRKNMNLMETTCVALWVGLVGFAIHVQAKYYEFELILALTR